MPFQADTINVGIYNYDAAVAAKVTQILWPNKKRVWVDLIIGVSTSFPCFGNSANTTEHNGSLIGFQPTTGMGELAAIGGGARVHGCIYGMPYTGELWVMFNADPCQVQVIEYIDSAL